MGCSFAFKCFDWRIRSYAEIAPSDRLELQISLENRGRLTILDGHQRVPFALSSTLQGYSACLSGIAYPADLSVGAHKVADRAIEDQTHRRPVQRLRSPTDDGKKVTLGRPHPALDACRRDGIDQTPAEVSAKGGFQGCEILACWSIGRGRGRRCVPLAMHAAIRAPVDPSPGASLRLTGELCQAPAIVNQHRDLALHLPRPPQRDRGSQDPQLLPDGQRHRQNQSEAGEDRDQTRQFKSDSEPEGRVTEPGAQHM